LQKFWHIQFKTNTKSPLFFSNLWTAFGLRILKWPGIGKDLQKLTKSWGKFSQTPKILGFG
jgi:hypothetical protein